MDFNWSSLKTLSGSLEEVKDETALIGQLAPAPDTEQGRWDGLIDDSTSPSRPIEVRQTHTIHRSSGNLTKEEVKSETVVEDSSHLRRPQDSDIFGKLFAGVLDKRTLTTIKIALSPISSVCASFVATLRGKIVLALALVFLLAGLIEFNEQQNLKQVRMRAGDPFGSFTEEGSDCPTGAICLPSNGKNATDGAKNQEDTRIDPVASLWPGQPSNSAPLEEPQALPAWGGSSFQFDPVQNDQMFAQNRDEKKTAPRKAGSKKPETKKDVKKPDKKEERKPAEKPSSPATGKTSTPARNPRTQGLLGGSSSGRLRNRPEKEKPAADKEVAGKEITPKTPPGPLRRRSRVKNVTPEPRLQAKARTRVAASS